MNAVVVAVIVMLVLSLSRVHVVLSLTVGAFVGGAVAGMPLQNIADAAGQVSQAGIIPVFNKGLEGGAKIALSYAMLGAFAMAITHSGMPQQLLRRGRPQAEPGRYARQRAFGRGRGQMAAAFHHPCDGHYESERHTHPHRLYPDDCSAAAFGV